MKRILITLLVIFATTSMRAQAAQTTWAASLGWTANSIQTGVTITGYEVFRAISGSTSYTNLTTTPLAATVTSYTDTTVALSTTYVYYIIALGTVSGVSGTLTSPQSNTVTLTIPSVTGIPAPTQNPPTVIEQTTTTSTTVTTKISGPLTASLKAIVK